MAGSIGFYIVSTLMMLLPTFSIVAALKYVLNGRLELGLSDHLFEFLRMLSPTIAFRKAFPLVVPSDVETFMANVDPSAPAYLAPEVALAILVAWLVVPAVFGLWQFNRADLADGSGSLSADHARFRRHVSSGPFVHPVARIVYRSRIS